MTYGRSIYRALDGYGIDRETWPQLAADRPAWRKAIHGRLLDGGRPTRAAAVETNRLISASAADERASARSIAASIASSFARVAPPPVACLPPRRAPLRDITNLPAALQ